MLTLIVTDEWFNDETQTFSEEGQVVLELEHSLLAISKWESIYQKAFLGPEEKSNDEMLDYIRYMILTPNVDDKTISRLNTENFQSIMIYLESSQSATTFRDTKRKVTKREVITSELIYYWMTSYNIPFECENWNLNRLFSLLRICDIKNSKPKKMTQREIAQQNRELNASRRAQLGSTG